MHVTPTQATCMPARNARRGQAAQLSPQMADRATRSTVTRARSAMPRPSELSPPSRRWAARGPHARGRLSRSHQPSTCTPSGAGQKSALRQSERGESCARTLSESSG